MTRVVVGVDGSRGAGAALRVAAEEAAQRGLPLRIVCAWEAAAGTYVGEAFAPTADGFVEAERHAEEVLRTALERVAVGAAVETEALAVEGSPAKVLVEQARDAALLVVGSRGRGAAASLLLGSVSQKLSHHAPCPLVIVPTPDE
jgi:nucleotide-binding universal stress UspA family protein